MTTFKVGDRVIIKKDYFSSNTFLGVASVRCIHGSSMCLNRDDKMSGGGCECAWKFPSVDYHGLELVDLKNNMSIKEKFVTAFMKEPEKSFRKAEITNGDGFLTPDGTQVFLGFLLAKHGVEFKKEVVDGLLEDEDKKKD